VENVFTTLAIGGFRVITTFSKKPPKRNGNRKRERNHWLLRERKRKILNRIAQPPTPDSNEPVMTATNIHHELADRVQGLFAGGIGAMLLVAQRSSGDTMKAPG
jgi:hypothetical protein